MKFQLRRVVAALLAVACLLVPAAVAALESGKTAQGWAYAWGGASHEELTELHSRRGDYSLWVVTAAMKTGAYLADVQVRIRDRKDKRVVFEQTIDGPWLFVALPLGSYEVEATLNGMGQRRLTTIHRGDHHQAFFYFDVPEVVGPDNRSPFDHNPYDAPKK
jgi:hypothetical protein